MMRPTEAAAAVRRKALRRGIRALAHATPWVESEVLGLAQLVARGDVCLDIGAGLGFYTAELAELTGSRGAVHSVEPLPFPRPAPSALLGLRDASNVRRHAVALGAAPGTSSMSVPVRRGRLVTGRSFLTASATGLGSNREFRDHVEFTVPVERLDRFCARLGIHHPDFVKADAEGAEWTILRGGRDLIERTRPRLLLEIEDRHLRRFGHDSGALVEWLTDRGYRMFVWRGGGWHPRRRVTAEQRNYLFSAQDPEPRTGR